MVADLIEMLPTVLTATVATAAAGVGISTACLPALKKALLPEPKEAFLSDILPFSHLDLDGKTLICKDGTKVRWTKWFRCLCFGCQCSEYDRLLWDTYHWIKG